MWPLSFKECYDAFGGDRKALWEDYYTYGSLPETLQFGSESDRMNFLNSIYDLSYLQDAFLIEEALRYDVKGREILFLRPWTEGSSSRKLIIAWDDIHRKINASGIVTISLLDFLLDRACLESM